MCDNNYSHDTWVDSVVRYCADVSKNRLSYLSSSVKIGQIFECRDTSVMLMDD